MHVVPLCKSHDAPVAHSCSTKWVFCVLQKYLEYLPFLLGGADPVHLNRTCDQPMSHFPPMSHHAARVHEAVTPRNLAGGPFFFASGVLYCIEFTGPNIIKGMARHFACSFCLTYVCGSVR